jgi:hypothetical protein
MFLVVICLLDTATFVNGVTFFDNNKIKFCLNNYPVSYDLPMLHHINVN